MSIFTRAIDLQAIAVSLEMSDYFFGRENARAISYSNCASSHVVSSNCDLKAHMEHTKEHGYTSSLKAEELILGRQTNLCPHEARARLTWQA